VVSGSGLPGRDAERPHELRAREEEQLVRGAQDHDREPSSAVATFGFRTSIASWIGVREFVASAA
jgi:hypothetical protein